MRQPIRGAAILAAGIGLLASAVVYGAYRFALAERHQQVAAGGLTARTSAGPIEYAVAGDGPTALVIHGAGGGYDQGLSVARGLFDRYRVVAPSRFGYLATPLPRETSPAAQADAHAALLDSLGIDQAIVAGVSAGAPSAVELALRHPERVSALILLVPMGYAPDHAPGVPDTPMNSVVLRIIYSGADFAYWAALRAARRIVVRFMGVEPELEAQAPASERQRISGIMADVLPLSRRLPGLRNDAITLQPLPLHQITAPTLIITATDDLYDTLPAARYMAERIPSAKLVVLESGGHLLVTRYGEVSGAIDAFLSGTVQPRSKQSSWQRLRNANDDASGSK
jgi:2-hydroxy-6-oxonona-2,4-dienedioate hydrolase